MQSTAPQTPTAHAPKITPDLASATLFAVGLGLYWCWRGITSSLDQTTSWILPTANNLEKCVPCLGGIVAAAFLYVAGGSGSSPESWRRRILAFGVLAGLGSVCATASNLLLGNTETLSLLLQGISFGLGICLVVCWGEVSAALCAQTMVLGVAGSVGVGGTCYILVGLLPLDALTWSFFCLMPVFSGMLCVVVWQRCSGDPSAADIARGEKPAAMGACAVVIAILVAIVGAEEVLRITFTQPSSAADELPGLFTWATQIGSILTAGAVCLVVLVSRCTPTFDAMTRVILPVVIVGFLSLLLLGNDEPSIAFTTLGIGYWCLRMLVWTTAAGIARHADVGAARIFSLVEGGICAVTVAAQFLGSIGSEQPASPVATVSVAILIAVLGVMVVLSGRFSRALEEGGGAARDHLREEDSAQPAPTDAEVLEAIRSRFGLTDREVEVLALLARGRSLPYIQEELSIAVGTAQAHVRHIYAKLDVHNRQELLDTVEGVRDELLG